MTPLVKLTCNSYAYLTDEEQRRVYNERRKYKRGSVPPNYPVPAIRREYEFGQDCKTGEIVLFCREYGTY